MHHQTPPARGARTDLIEAGGHRLRTATWRLDEDTAAPPLLFFNGIGANIETIAPLAERLTDRAVITFDMPGIGRSPDPVLPYNPLTMAWSASLVLDTLGIGRTDVMGFSWGGALAQQYALQHPSRTGRLVLASTFAGMFMVPGDLSILARMALSQRFADARYLNEHLLALYDPAPARPLRKLKVASRLLAPSTCGFMQQIAALAGWTSYPFLPCLSAPTLVLTGDEDHIVPPANAELLAAAIPGARLKTLAGAGHLGLLTHLDETAALLGEFLER